MGSISNSVGSNFEELGHSLQHAITAYTSFLKKEGIPMPSLLPPSATTPRLRSQKEFALQAEIVHKAQQITAMAMDAEINLLISSLQFHFCTCLRVAVDLRIHELVPREGTISVAALAKATDADEVLLVRTMRVLTTRYVFLEPEPFRYTHSAMSSVLCKQFMPDLLSHRLNDVFRSASRHADALEQIRYREPAKDDVVGFNLAYFTPYNFWEYIRRVEPKMGERFDRAMHAVNINTIDAIPWLYPFDTLAAAGNILVDVGGGLGHVSKQILAAYPDSGLECIVQDVVALCESVDRVNNLKLQLHSFFDPQPVRGAAAYFFRHIFHDWADDACVTILRRTVDAMDVEQSRILICDQIMDELNPSVASMLYDIDMMSLFGGKERSLGQWEDLLMQADPRLYIRRVWKNAATLTVIIEVRLKNSK